MSGIGTRPAGPRLPRNVYPAPLAGRVAAYLLDSVPGYLVAIAVVLCWWLASSRVLLVVACAGALAMIAWAVYWWFRVATRGISPGMAVARIELTAYRTGKPIGFGRVLLRTLIFGALGGTAIGWVALIVTMLFNPLHQGWHDLAVGSVMIRMRRRGGRPRPAATVQRDRPAGDPVPLPAHLRSAADAFAPRSTAPVGSPSSGAPRMPPVVSTAGGYAAAPAGDPTASSAPVETGRVPIDRVPYGAPVEVSPLDQETGSEATRLVPKRGGAPARAMDQGWVIALDDGRQVAVKGVVLVGRAPAPRPGEQVADLISVTDNSRMVSKTHIAVGVDNKGVFVMDRGSTNGSAIAMPSGAYEPCPPGEQVRVREGQIISFGDHRMEIRRTY